MLKELTLENFKAFKDKVKIPLAPITLIFGENSSGKSSILQSLGLLKQSCSQQYADTDLVFKPRDVTVDLGNYSETVFEHNSSLPINIGATMSNKDQKYTLEFEFQKNHINKQAKLNAVSIPLAGDNFVARFELFKNIPNELKNGLESIFIDFDEFGSKGLFKGMTITQSELYWSKPYRMIQESVVKPEEAIASDNGEIMLGFDNRLGQFVEEFAGSRIIVPMIPEEIRGGNFSIQDYIKWISMCFTYSYVESNGFLQFNQSIGKLPVVSTHDPVHIIRTGSWLLRKSLESLVSLGPIRKQPQRWFELNDVQTNDVGYDGAYMPQLLLTSPLIKKEVNRWLDSLDMGYSLQVEPLSSGLFELKLFDTKNGNKIEIYLPNVGYGVSQVLPIITQSVASRESIIAIEQPEVHIHPKLQAELGNLFAESSRPPYNNQFIIETHSEHLILRLQRLVRNGILSPEDLSVLYVQKSSVGEGSKVIHLQLDGEGDFIDEWPGGFFPERLDELLR
ncbi:MAG: AAA family ATPase [Bacteroidales bacterium]|nr:AAA family ATPase [Bacteroidales bacterium]